MITIVSLFWTILRGCECVCSCRKPSGRQCASGLSIELSAMRFFFSSAAHGVSGRPPGMLRPMSTKVASGGASAVSDVSAGPPRRPLGGTRLSHVPDKSGLPFGMRGAGASRFGRPSAVRGMSGVRWIGHCADAEADRTTARTDAKTTLIPETLTQAPCRQERPPRTLLVRRPGRRARPRLLRAGLAGLAGLLPLSALSGVLRARAPRRPAFHTLPPRRRRRRGRPLPRLSTGDVLLLALPECHRASQQMCGHGEACKMFTATPCGVQGPPETGHYVQKTGGPAEPFTGEEVPEPTGIRTSYLPRRPCRPARRRSEHAALRSGKRVKRFRAASS